MVSFYLASRHVVEAPACQLSTTVGRPLLENRTEHQETEDTELWKLLNSQKEICSVPLTPFGVSLGCRTREALDQDYLVPILRNGHPSENTFRASSETMREANAAVWKAAHCESSTWQAVPTEDYSFCGYEFCVESSPPERPMKALNRLLTRGEHFKIFAGVLPIFVCS